MAHIVNVAEYVLDKIGPMTAGKLQKLLYYCQAWHLAWIEKPLYLDKIEAWRSGPVVPNLFKLHQGHFKLQPGFFEDWKSSEEMDEHEKDVIDRVIDYYGHKDPHWLNQLTHMEDPWKHARRSHQHGLQEQKETHHHPHDTYHLHGRDKFVDEITHHAIFEYYSSL